MQEKGVFFRCNVIGTGSRSSYQNIQTQCKMGIIPICCLLEQTLFAETQPTKLSTKIIPASCAQIEETALFTALTKKQPHVMLIHYYSILLFFRQQCSSH